MNQRHRVILLGASNLAVGAPVVFRELQRYLPGPKEICGAFGHGRSFGKCSRVFFRRLPGILQCGLWDRLAETTPSATFALITDIGNDLMFEVPADEVAKWIESCVERLAQRDAKIVMTQLPLENIEHIGPRKYALMKRLMFPRSGISLTDLRIEVEKLSNALLEMSGRHDIQMVMPSRQWYGWDPIHIRRDRRAPALACIFSHWRDQTSSTDIQTRSGFRDWKDCRLAMPAEYWLFGRPCHRRQPCARFRNGDELWLY